MLDGMFVFNAVAHAYNMTDENTQSSRYAQRLRDMLLGPHSSWQPGYGLDFRAQRTDRPIDVLAKTQAVEERIRSAPGVAGVTLRINQASMWS